VGELSYLIRYGVMSHVGRFSALPMCDTIFERGQLVVIRTDRGVELGEVLIAVEGKTAAPGDRPGATAAQEGEIDPGSLVAANSQHVLRLADPEDLARSKSAQAARPSRFSVCQRILQEGNWPWELIDVEPLLDGRATVIHYLGPHRLDVAPVRARFRVECDIDVVLEPIGSDLESEATGEDLDPHEIGAGCGNCGCTDGGGCGSASVPGPVGHGHEAEPVATGCAPRSHSGCSSCGISKMLVERARARA